MAPALWRKWRRSPSPIALQVGLDTPDPGQYCGRPLLGASVMTAAITASITTSGSPYEPHAEPDDATGAVVPGAAPMATLEPVRFGEFLRDRLLITEEQWLAALADHWSARVRRSIGASIVARGFLPRAVVEEEARAFHDELEIVEV